MSMVHRNDEIEAGIAVSSKVGLSRTTSSHLSGVHVEKLWDRNLSRGNVSGLAGETPHQLLLQSQVPTLDVVATNMLRQCLNAEILGKNDPARADVGNCNRWNAGGKACKASVGQSRGQKAVG